MNVNPLTAAARLMTVSCVVGALLCAGAPAVQAQDAVAADPKHYSVEFGKWVGFVTAAAVARIGLTALRPCQANDESSAQ